MKSGSNEPSGSKRVIALTVLVVIVIGAVTGLIIYGDKVAPFRATVLQVDDVKVSMRYFLKRAAQSYDTPQAVLSAIATEEIIKKVAPELPYGIKVSEENLDRAMRDLAARELTPEDTESDELISISESEFNGWLEEQLESTHFTEREYRDLVLRSLLRAGLSQYLAERIPTVAEQVKLYVITLATLDEARAVIDRLSAGEDFAAVAEELLSDEKLIVDDYDIGWRPRGAVSASFAGVAFDELEVGEYSEPLLIGGQYYAIIKLADRAKARQVDDEIFQILQSNAFDAWLQQELPYHNISVHGLNNGFDQETEAWVRWQLQNY